jgi:DNA helicase-2/ATP-dependent DNA helicase PcrA
VPGSGKTFTLSHLAARLVEKLSAEGKEDQEVLVVTFSNSAANSFKKRIADILQRERQLLPYVGYRVRTLHGLAHDIVRERPSLLGLADDFQIIDERVALAILRDVVYSYSATWGDLIDAYILPGLDERRARQVRQYDFPELLVEAASLFIKRAKDYELLPSQIRDVLVRSSQQLRLLEFGVSIYEDYQRNLRFRGAVDFDDLVVLALQALQADAQYLERLRGRWVYVLEDEAQDSSALQEKMLRLLTGERNWVRVGDPNQAINTTFTTANPKYLRTFLDQPGVQKRDLPVSGRSGQPIIDLANELVRWACFDHPAEELRDAFYYQQILPVPLGDPQPNPPAEQTRVHIHYQPGVKVMPEREIELVVDSLGLWLPENPDKTVAVLVPENERGVKVSAALAAVGIPYEELLRSTTQVRRAASLLCGVLRYLAEPFKVEELVCLYQDVWCALSLAALGQVDVVSGLMRKSRNAEELVYGGDLSGFFSGLDGVVLDDLGRFFDFVAYCLAALSLPVDQLVLVVAQRIFARPVDLALAYRISVLLRLQAEENPAWSLLEFSAALDEIAQNQRRFLGFEDAAEGYIPVPGKVSVATMHAAKGLEWDRVYLLSVNNYSFPSFQAYDTYVSDRWFVRDGLNFSEEMLAQLDVVSGVQYSESLASVRGRVAYSAERLRLLYVSVTRARFDLVVLWNVGRFAGKGFVCVPAVPLVVLSGYLSS